MADEKTSNCWPSVQTISAKTGQCERTVQSCLRDLLRRGIITSKPRPGTSTVFTFTPANSAPPQELPPADFATHPRNGCTPPPQILPSTPANSAPRTLKNPQLKPKEAVGTRFALTAPPDEWRQAALILFPAVNVDQAFAKFSDYWISQPGQKGRKSDWIATWRNWVRNDRERAPRSTRPSQPQHNGHGNGLESQLFGQPDKLNPKALEPRIGESQEAYDARIRHSRK